MSRTLLKPKRSAWQSPGIRWNNVCTIARNSVIVNTVAGKAVPQIRQGTESEMHFYTDYTSATIASCGQQTVFDGNGKKQTGRLFVKLNQDCSEGFRVMFQNVTDGTYPRGTPTFANHFCDEWTLSNMRACIFKGAISAPPENVLPPMDGCAWTSVLFDGKTERTVNPGEFFESDEFVLEGRKNDYLCLEYEFCGGIMPCHEEVRLPVYVLTDGEWRFNVHVPLPSFIGVKKQKKARIVYFGDSITQGIGPAINSYAHWTAVTSELIGDEYAHWNVGVGYGRAGDGVTEGAWYYKAKHADIVFLCFGINDLNGGFEAEQICKNLEHIVDLLKKRGCKVIVQTLPPFDFTDGRKEKWERVNGYVRTQMPGKADLVFDCVKILGRPDAPHLTIYGGHPNAEGSRLWGEAVFAAAADIVFGK